MVGYENDHLGILRACKVLKQDVKAIIGPFSTTTSKIVSEFPDLVNNVFGFVMLPNPVDMPMSASSSDSRLESTRLSSSRSRAVRTRSCRAVRS